MASLRFALATFAALFATSAASAPHKLFSVSNSSVTHWGEVADASAAHKLELLFFLKQQNGQELHDTLMRVSDPASPTYGQHLTQAEVDALTAPRPEHRDAVESWLSSSGIEFTAASSDAIRAVVSVEQAEQLMNADYRRFEHSVRGDVVHRTLSYSLPAHVADALDLVGPTNRFPGRGRVAALRDDTPEGLFNTPSSLRKLYSVGSTKGSGGKSGSRQAVTGFLKQYYSASDFAKFQSKYDSENAGLTIATKGDDATGTGGVESMLDAEYITALGPGVETEFWGFSGNAPDAPENEPFLKWLTLVSSTSDDEVPKLFSTSYGEDEVSTTKDYAARCNAEFQKAGARGISLLVASGDSGVAGDKGGCPGGKYVPMWPAASPYVTAVGGTTGSSPETTAGLSSGGFSNYFATPTWQKNATANYIANGGADPSKYNASGRGFPDISAQATGFMVIAGGGTMPGVAGTSCATPTAGGVFGLLNDMRAQAGKSSLGFLNPFIYANADAFNDVTSGSNNGCSFLSKGFAAIPGWDPATGVGTPDYVRLAAAVSALP